MKSLRQNNWLSFLLVAIILSQSAFHCLHVFSFHHHCDYHQLSHDDQKMVDEPGSKCDLCIQFNHTNTSLELFTYSVPTFFFSQLEIESRESVVFSEPSSRNLLRGPPLF